jgi:hypothetical protein
MPCTIGLAAAFPGRRILPVLLPAHTREQEKKNRKYWCGSGGGLHCAREAMDMSGLASVQCVVIIIRRFASELQRSRGFVRVKENVTMPSHLMLANFHPGQKGWARNILFLIIQYHLVLANLSDQLKLGFTYIKNKHEEEDVSLTDDDQVALRGCLLELLVPLVQASV